MRSQAALTSRLARIGAWIAARARRVLLAFVAAMIAAGLYGSSVAERLPAGGFEVTGGEAWHAARATEAHFGMGAADVVVVYRNPEGDVRDALFGIQIVDVLDPVLQDPGVASAVTYYDTQQETLVSLDGHETVVVLSLAGDNIEKMRTLRRIEPLLRAVEPPTEALIGGHLAASLLAQELARADVARAELFALPIAAALALLFFRSVVAALLPIAIGAFALDASAAAIRFGSTFTEISIFAMNVCAFLGLGISIDYALLLVQRFREERRSGRPIAEVVAATLDTAGRAVLVSGVTVAVSLAALLPVPLPILRSVAIGGVLVVGAALVGALLLLPALLAWLGAWVDRGAIGRAPEEVGPSPFWRRVGTFSMRHPVGTALGCVAVLAALAGPALRMRIVVPDTRMFATDAEVRRVDELLADPERFDPGGASAVQVVVRTRGSPLEPDNLRALRAYTAGLEALPGVAGVRSPVAELDPDALDAEQLARRAAREPTASLIQRMVDGDTTLLIVANRHPWRAPEASDVVRAVRALPHPDLEVLTGGPTARMVDVSDALGAYAPWAVGSIALWSFLVLLLSFRSVVVPVKAVVMTVLSLGASYGLLVWVFQDGHGAQLLDFVPMGGIDPSIPLVMFAVVFGLSMDYEIFLLSRIREAWLRTRDNRESVIQGLANTGRIITSAALILLVVVGAFAAGDLVYVKQIGLGMAAAIALDVTLVRALLVPATMQLLGAWNWWLPAGLSRRA